MQFRTHRTGIVCFAVLCATWLVSAPAQQPKFKAIWEPVNIKEDIELQSVRFVSAEEGWVAGGRNALAGGVIFHTTDAGANWQVEAGDPQSSDRAFGDLRFLGSKLGFAVQSTSGGDHQLLRTTDGQTWNPVGTVAQHRTDYQFTSAEVGFAAAGNDILRTTDAGRKWERVYQCRIKAEINGLTREVPCSFEKLFFVDAQTGYAMSRSVAAGAGFVIARTADGGTTWTPNLVLPGEDGKEGGLYFINAETGILRTISGKLFRTADAGKTWIGVSGHIDGKPRIDFAGPDAGWMVRYHTMLYTSNGGKSWISRDIAFPASVDDASLARRDCGYAVGAHGMVFRYRVVPVDYSAKGMLPAPAIAPPQKP